MNEVLPRLIKSPYKITKLKVVRDDTGASVVVRVNDRGPYVDGRILDLSVAAGKDIGLDKVGHAKVTATVIVLPRLIKSPYKIYFLNIPYFMRVRKRLDAEKIRKIG